LPFWFARNLPTLVGEVLRADALHTPIPGDVGSVGMSLGFILGKPLFVRYCGNWAEQRTAAEHGWRWFMERFAGDRNVFLATGGSAEPPSARNAAIRWIFSTTLSEGELGSCSAVRRPPPGRSPRLIIVCRQERLKGSAVVIRSMPLLHEHFPGATLDVVGEGAALQEFKELAVALGIAERVTFHGKVDHETVLRLLRESNIFCYPTSASEGFPKVVHEALACGLPVVTTRVSVLPQLIGTDCGCLLDEATPEAVAHAVRQCIGDLDRYRALSTRAAETAKAYSLERWRDTIGDLLRTAWGPLRADA
jgi:glycosyltransferase involved in cell wall biosynthesis